MQNYKHILAIDPSGNWSEGKGTTGICLLKSGTLQADVYSISATQYDRPETYWHAHLEFINLMCKQFDDIVVVVEDYLLYANKAVNQVNSRMETPKLIGIIEQHCYMQNLPYFMEPAAAVKTRWTNPILEHKGLIEKRGRSYYIDNHQLCTHHLDAIRHAIHFDTFINGKKEGIRNGKKE